LHEKQRFALRIAVLVKQSLSLGSRNEGKGSILGACQRGDAQRREATLRRAKNTPLATQRDVLLSEQESISG